MFHGFAHVWTIVGASDMLRARPLGLRVAGERLVLFRDGAGVARALVDRCPHRGVQLSLGRVVDGCLECPFHGWRFAGDGANCKVPWDPDARRERLGATPVPVRELGGLLWLYTAPGGEAPGEPEVPELLLRAGVRVCSFAVTWQTHWTRAMENMLDWPHLPFVHRRTIGKNLPYGGGTRMDIAWDERSWGGRTTISVDGAPQEGMLDYRFPNAMQLWLPTGKRLLGFITACVPVDERTTSMVFVTIRDFMRPRLFDRLFHLANRKIAEEDRAVLESSDPVEVPPPGEERSVRTDGPTLQFRKIYRERLQGSRAEVPGRLRVLQGDGAGA
ncbi:MAG: aromatic ring-hydroxylating dioxygenase subunit alpha [Myxococcales bacterium]|nr:aromatic ring-hydroxylating dioxygenase subunit alpha [Myxococcales bacterium]